MSQESATKSTEEPQEVQINLAEHLKLKGYPPIWNTGPQDHRTRDFISKIKRAIDSKKALNDEDVEYYGIYKRITGNIEETFEYFKYTKKENIKEEIKLDDLKELLIDWQGKVTIQIIKSIEENSSRAIKEAREMAREAMTASRDAAKALKDSLDVMGKYYVEMVDKVTKSSENNAKYMSETLKTLNTIIGDLLKAFGVHVQTYDELSKKKLKELVKMFEEKSLDDPAKSKDFMDKLNDFLPVVKAGIEASGREVPPGIKAALDKFSEIQNNQS